MSKKEKESKESKKNLHLENELKDIKKKSSGFISEFKTFIARGNVMDLAVGVIIGGAFSNIVTSLTNNILMPIVGIVVGGFNFSELACHIKVWGREVVLNYGVFIQNTVDFLLTALCIFIIIKFINRFFNKKKEEEKPAAPVKSDEVKLLEEIRDLLKKQK